MDPTIEIGLLYDTYGFILTDTQKALCEAYYYEDLSLTEVAENRGISKQAVSSQLNRVVSKLRGMEEELHLVEKERVLRDELTKLREILETGRFNDPSQGEKAILVLQRLEACFFGKQKVEGGDYV